MEDGCYALDSDGNCIYPNDAPCPGNYTRYILVTTDDNICQLILLIEIKKQIH